MRKRAKNAARAKNTSFLSIIFKTSANGLSLSVDAIAAKKVAQAGGRCAFRKWNSVAKNRTHVQSRARK
jgi:hypothetical protein